MQEWIDTKPTEVQVFSNSTDNVIHLLTHNSTICATFHNLHVKFVNDEPEDRLAPTEYDGNIV